MLEGEVYTGRIGKAETPLQFEQVRELTPEDLIVRSACNVGSKAPGIKSLRAMHHKLAQCLQTMSDAEASIATGYSPSRISILKADPTFQELLAHYAEVRQDVYVDVQQRMAGFATNALEVLQERLDERPDAFSVKDLNSLIKTTADRGGHSPVSRTEHKSVIIDAVALARLKEEVESKQNGQVRKINQAEEAKRVKQFSEGEVRQELPGSKEPEISSNDNRPASTVLEETPA